MEKGTGIVEEEYKESMTKTQKLFFACVDSRIQDHGSLYGRFHIGTFFRGQALTFANALRRTLLSEIPGVVLTDVVIDGAGHEFASLPGVEEPVLDILLNLKNVVFAPTNSDLSELEVTQPQGLLKCYGPARVTAADIKLPSTMKCVNPKTHIATLTNGEEFSLRFTLSVRSPHESTLNQKKFLNENISSQNEVDQKTLVTSGPKTKFWEESLLLEPSKAKKLSFDSVPMPVQKVNYVIKSFNAKQGSEYVVFEVWTDGSICPQEVVQFGLKKLTQLFYQFALRSK